MTFQTNARDHRKGRNEDVDGWLVIHCGHPTAHWPWSLRAPPGHPADGTTIVSFNGLGFQTKRAAVAVARELAAGTAMVTRERCAGITCCVVGRTAMGQRIADDREALR